MIAGRFRRRVAGVLRRRRGAPDRGEDGSAVVEFLGVSLLLLVPILYLVLTLARIQAAAFAAEGAAREAGRIIAVAQTLETGSAHAHRAVEVAFSDQGIDVVGPDVMRLTCAADPCLTPGAEVLVQIGVTVALPLVPDFLADVVPTQVPVSATHLVAVGIFQDAP